MISEAKRKSAKCKLQNADCKMPDEDPGVLMEKLHGVWNRHISGEARLLRPAAEFVGAVLAGEDKLVPGSKAYDKALGLIEVATPAPQASGLKPQASRAKPQASPATRIPEAESAADNALRGEGRDIPIELIVASPFNPRKDFAEAELLSLAASIEAHGLLEPIVVRPRDDGRYELVAGERRWKACQRAGLAKVPAVVRRLDDQQAKELCVLENLQRKDLSPIEEAEGFKMLLEGANAPTQGDLAKRLGVSQPHIANRLALLRLPACWRKRIASGQVPATHARALTPFAGHPKLLEAIDKDLAKDLEWDGSGTVEQFEDAVDSTVGFVTRELVGKEYEYRVNGRVPYFTPTPEQRKQLQVIEIEGRNGAPVEVALNKPLWEKLQKAHVEKYVKEHHAKGSKTKAAPAKKPASQMTPAEKKAEQARQRQREQLLAKQFARRLADWRTDWIRYLIARQLDRPDEADRTLIRLLLYFAASPGTFKTLGDLEERTEVLKPHLASAGQALKTRSVDHHYGYRDADVWRSLAALPGAGLNDVAVVARHFVRNMFWSGAGPGQAVPPADVEAIAAWLGIDLAATWQREQAGPLTETYLALHSKEQLAELADAWGVFIKPESTPKGTVIRMLTIKDRPTTLPKELAQGGRGR